MKEKENYTIIKDESIITLVNWNKELFDKCYQYQEEKLQYRQEIERLNNIINKIELALELNIEDLKEYSEMKSRVDEDEEILRFIKELKENKNEKMEI